MCRPLRLFLVSLLAVTAAPAAQRVADYTEAMERASETGRDIAVFLYGSDWSRAGQGLKQRVWDAPSFVVRAGPDLVLLAVDYPEGLHRNQLNAHLVERLAVTENAIVAPGRAVSEQGAALTAQPDGSVLATGSNPAKDVYELEFATPDRAGDVVIVEFLPDASLPAGGPGRASNGNFVVTEVTGTVQSDGTEETLSFEAAWVNHLYTAKEPPAIAIDGQVDPARYWNAGTHNWHRPLQLALVPSNPVPPGATLRLRLHCVSRHASHVPGRVRVKLLPDRETAAAIRDWYRPEVLRRRNAAMPCSTGNYPALFLVDAQGRVVARRDGMSLADTAEDIVGWLHDEQTMRRERDRLWQAADEAQGPARAALLFQGLDLMGQGLGVKHAYRPVFEAIKAADPEDVTHAARRYALDTKAIGARLQAVLKEQGPTAAAAYLDSELEHPGNTVLAAGQMQSLYWMQYNFFRGQEAFKDRQDEPLRKIAELEPMSPLGYGCAGRYLMRSGPPSVRYGWAPRHCRTESLTWIVGGQIEPLHQYVPEAGAYDVALHFGSGEALVVSSVTALVNGRPVATAGEPVTLGPDHRQATFSLELPAVQREQTPQLRIVCHSEGASTGTIRITPARPPEPQPEASGRDPDELPRRYRQLAAGLRAAAKLTSPRATARFRADLRRLADDPRYVHRLMQYEILRLADPAKLGELLQTTGGAAFLDRFFEEDEWMTEFLCCGPHGADPAAELGHLAGQWQHDPDIGEDPVWQRFSVANAVAGGGALPRLDYFRESDRLGRLHRQFYENHAWVMRFTLGIDPAGARFLRDLVNRPMQAYGNIHYLAAYRSHSIFGDSIQGPHFFRPWAGLPKMQQIKWAGGVCGSLTTLGEMVYKSHGSPAQGMGEPGHRSYVLRYRPGYWQKRYSMHAHPRTRSFYGGNYRHLGIMEKVWGDMAAIRRASIHLWQARLYRPDPRLGDSTHPVAAEEFPALELAMEAHPLFIDGWQEEIRRRTAAGNLDPRQWLSLTGRIVGATAPLGQDAPYDLWRRFEADSVDGLSTDDMIEFHLRVQRVFRQHLPGALTSLAGMLRLQAGHLGKDSDAWLRFASEVLALHRDSPNASAAAGWAVEAAKAHRADFARYATLMVDTLALEAKQTDEALKRRLFPQLLEAAAALKDFQAYHALAAAADRGLPLDQPAERYLNAAQLKRYPEIRPFPGELVSAEGLVRLWRPAKYDRVLQHHRLLDTRGGYLHADPHQDAWVMVELPRPATLNGIVVVNRYEGKFAADQVPLKVALSTDGRHWQEIYSSAEAAPMWRVDLTAAKPKARYVKVYTHREKVAYFQLRNILVYGAW